MLTHPHIYHCKNCASGPTSAGDRGSIEFPYDLETIGELRECLGS